jgi:pilus assembly protein Flp/PilA
MALFTAKKIKTFGKDKKGVTMLEYGIIAALIAVVCIGTITTIGTKLNAAFTTISTDLPAASN